MNATLVSVVYLNARPSASIISLAGEFEEAGMRWTPGGNSEDVEDRRDESGDGGGGGGFGFGGIHLGIGGTIIVLLLSLVFKRDFFALLGGGQSVVVADQDDVGCMQSILHLLGVEERIVVAERLAELAKIFAAAV